MSEEQKRSAARNFREAMEAAKSAFELSTGSIINEVRVETIAADTTFGPVSLISDIRIEIRV